MNLIQIKYALLSLSLVQLRRLDDWLHELIRSAEEAERADKIASRKPALTKRTFENKTYRMESIRCGRENCKCARGKLHGPYWYSYTRIKDKVRSQYIGKKLPKDIERRLRIRKER
jgi:hypothetical protein